MRGLETEDNVFKVTQLIRGQTGTQIRLPPDPHLFPYFLLLLRIGSGFSLASGVLGPEGVVGRQV